MGGWVGGWEERTESFSSSPSSRPSRRGAVAVSLVLAVDLCKGEEKREKGFCLSGLFRYVRLGRQVGR